MSERERANIRQSENVDNEFQLLNKIYALHYEGSVV